MNLFLSEPKEQDHGFIPICAPGIRSWTYSYQNQRNKIMILILSVSFFPVFVPTLFHGPVPIWSPVPVPIEFMALFLRLINYHYNYSF